MQRGCSFTQLPVSLNQSYLKIPRRFPCQKHHIALNSGLSPRHAYRKVRSLCMLPFHLLHRSSWAVSSNSGYHGKCIPTLSIPRKLTSLMARESMLALSIVSRAEGLTRLKSGKRAKFIYLVRSRVHDSLRRVADGNMPALRQVFDRSRSGWRKIR